MRLVALLLSACVALTACTTTPYSPPVLVKGSTTFIGLADLLDPAQPLQVLLVHGMCTHDKKWANDAFAALKGAMDSNVAPPPWGTTVTIAGAAPKVEIERDEADIFGSKLRMAAIIWSPLTAPLKQQLLYDNTDEPNDCATAASCSPKRATLNGLAKDKLLNDCLADAMAYQGDSRETMRAAMVEAFSDVLKDSPPNARIVLIADSLGSKLSFDALSAMLASPAPNQAKSAAARLGQIFMNANQLPILGLADQVVSVGGPPPARKPDALEKFLSVRPASMFKLNAETPSLTVVAFTDPNDLLSYRLLPSRYASKDVAVADVLVSNEKTYFGLVERPDTAHTEYMANKEVAAAIACGMPKSKRCR